MRMSTVLPSNWVPWRSASPLGDRRPTKTEMSEALYTGLGREDVLPFPTDEQCAGAVRLLVVGINPSPWTAAVNAPFARPGNRFWSSLAAADVLPQTVDASTGLSRDNERLLAELGLGVTNLVSRPTARADELTRDELQAGGRRLVDRVNVLRPRVVAILGITAFRTAFSFPRATLGRQTEHEIQDWPESVELWAMPNPSGLNAHENITTLAEKWATVWERAAQ